MKFNLVVKKEDLGNRLDKYLVENEDLREELSELTRGDFARAIKGGDILVNGNKVKPSYSLKNEDRIEINISKRESRLLPNSKVKINTIHEDKNILVINKLVGVQIHPGVLNEKDTLVSGLIYRYPEIIGVGDESVDAWLRPGIVHRLDKDTSGVLIVARNKKSFDELKKLFKDRGVTKKYLALVYGKVSPKEGVIDAPIARATSYKKQVIAGKKTKTTIREATTKYSVKKEFKNYSLVEVMPKTGRMHQIRVHFSHLGNPIMGDKIYKKKEFSGSNFPHPERQLLHASEINFELFNEKYSFKSELPEDMLSYVD